MSYKNMKYTEYFQIYNDLCDKHRKEVENLTSEIRIDVADILYRLGTEFVELDFDFTGKKVILYAPTWRESTDNGKTCAIKPPVDAKKWEEALKDYYVVCVFI